MGIISVEQVDHLYWLGRYTERVYTTLKIYSESFDRMIDESEDSYQKYCDSLDIPNIYESKEDFLKRYPFDISVPDSIISNLNRAYDNAIVLRETIGSEALSYIQLSIYAMNNASVSDAPLIDLQQIMDDLLSFWGLVDDQIDSDQIRNIIKAGKRIERIDLYARMEVEKLRLVREVRRMIPRVLRSGMKYDDMSLSRVSTLINDVNLDYEKIITNVEKIISY
ncbi:MAG: alpha-E domain-containing protein [Eubacterium sp.]|nr:alpha-E domain-containing protein [Eubacterium sp.]